MAILKGTRSLLRMARSHELVASLAANMPLPEPHQKRLMLPRVSLPRSCNLPSVSTTQNNGSEQDRHIKTLLKQLKRLEIALGKFDGKLTGIAKTNILRTVVLPFLRLLPPLHTVFDINSKIYASFSSIYTSVLGLWWKLLLLCLNATGPLQVSSSDRSAYLECVSRILARKEWFHADHQAAGTYTQCLTDTLDYSIVRLLSFKVVPISISAFVGKVFAYSFFHLAGVSNALLFLLNVKQKTLDKLLLAFLAPLRGAIDKARTAFPQNVLHLIDYKGLEKLERMKRGAINSVVPPKHPVRGIRDPSGPWVRRWCSSDSDLFNSFFRHYINIAHSFTDGCLPISVMAFPGFRIVASFIYQVVSVSVNRILLNKATPNVLPHVKQSVSATPGPLHKPSGGKETTTGSNLPPSSLPYKQADTNYTSITKLFRSIRDISYLLIPFSNQVTRIVDQLLVTVAKNIGLYDVNKTSLLLNLVYEYSIHVFDASDMDWPFWLECSYLMLTHTYHVQIITRNFAFLFNVWERIPDLLRDCDMDKLGEWLGDPRESLKTNFSAWLTSNSVWFMYFTHWNPLVRSHYLRLLVWRVIGINNYETSCSIQTTRRVKQKTDYIFESLCKCLDSGYPAESLHRLDFSSDLPIVNRKFGIVPINNKYSYLDEISSLMTMASLGKPSDLRKTHPYEIFDEAIYTCTSLPSSPSATPSKAPDLVVSHHKLSGNHSIIDSLSRFFKLLSTDEASDKDALTMSPPQRLRGNNPETGGLGRGRPLSKSMTSISTEQSMKSLSSSPSLISFQSTPDSNTEHSTASSVTSDSDSSISDRAASSSTSTYSTYSSNSSFNQPPELIKIPPEIVRPIFKLDIVLDHELASSKLARMQESKMSWGSKVFYGSHRESNRSYLTLPKPPKIPSVSIFLNSDAYNRFFITRETYLLNEEVLCLPEAEDLNSFRRDLERRLEKHTELIALGKALNEWNLVVEEFEGYLFQKVEADQANYVPAAVASGDEPSGMSPKEINEVDYFARIIPLLPIDNLTELKLLNAA